MNNYNYRQYGDIALAIWNIHMREQYNCTEKKGFIIKRPFSCHII